MHRAIYARSAIQGAGYGVLAVGWCSGRHRGSLGD